MEVSGLGQADEVKLTGAKTTKHDAKSASDAFSQLIAALFLNLSQNSQIVSQSQENLQGNSMSGTSEMQTCRNENFMSMIGNMSEDALKMLKGSNGENSDIESILKELGITDGQDMDNAIDQLLKASGIITNDISVNGDVKKIIEDAEKRNSAFKSLIEQVSKQIKALNDSSENKNINAGKTDDKKNYLKMSEYIKNDESVKNTNIINTGIEISDIKSKANNTILEADSKNDLNNSQGNNLEQTVLFDNKHINAGNETKTFEVSSSTQKDIQNPFIEKPQDLVEVAVNRFKSLRLPDFTEMRVKLRPEELGEVTVKVILEKGQINGSIVADRKDVVSMLQNQIDYLKNELKSSNINFNNITIHYDTSGEFSGHNDSRNFNQQGKNNGKRFLMEMEENPEETNSNNGFSIIA